MPRTQTIEITASRGARWDGTDYAHRWWADDPQHAASFGKVRQGTLRGSALVIDTAAGEWADLWGAEADELLHKMLRDSGADMLVMFGWEGCTCYYLGEDAEIEVDGEPVAVVTGVRPDFSSAWDEAAQGVSDDDESDGLVSIDDVLSGAW